MIMLIQIDISYLYWHCMCFFNSYNIYIFLSQNAVLLQAGAQRGARAAMGRTDKKHFALKILVPLLLGNRLNHFQQQ